MPDEQRAPEPTWLCGHDRAVCTDKLRAAHVAWCFDVTSGDGRASWITVTRWIYDRSCPSANG
ncbi:hypothetical protein GCM10010116_15680 [Microbispora rosea subsp. aerata]|nr:hypothetical protein GCM10010116_15680 [Microbispora rosea subsp. aerata]GLJ83820.1 hypothetical protein GCM10017588_25480 [Microbispora rosea subsp. aerata]